jgi:CheY-like chemotaxis protein
LQGLRILVAEDNSTNQLVAVKIAKRMGCEVHAVTDGKLALEALRNVVYDLVLMDCQMPGMDGFEAARQIRSQASGVLNPAIPIIALTASILDDTRAKCLDAGMNDYLIKPVEPQSLARALEQWSDPSLKAQGSGGAAPSAVLIAPSASALPPAPPTAPIGASQIFDRPALIRRVMGDLDLAQAITANFGTEMPRSLEALMQAVAARDASRTQALAHKIRGAVATVGGVALLQIAIEMERAGKAGDLRSLETLAPQLQDQFAILNEVLTTQTWGPSEATSPQKGIR